MIIPVWLVIVIILVLAWPVQYKIFGNPKSYSDYMPVFSEILAYMMGLLITSVSLLCIYLIGYIFIEIGKMLFDIPWKEVLNKEIFYIH